MLLQKLSLFCSYQIVTFFQLPKCFYQIVITKLSLQKSFPNCHEQIVITQNPPALSCSDCEVNSILKISHFFKKSQENIIAILLLRAMQFLEIFP